MKFINLILMLSTLIFGVVGFLLSGQLLSRLFFVIALFTFLIRLLRFVALEFYCEENDFDNKDVNRLDVFK